MRANFALSITLANMVLASPFHATRDKPSDLVALTSTIKVHTANINQTLATLPRLLLNTTTITTTTNNTTLASNSSANPTIAAEFKLIAQALDEAAAASAASAATEEDGDDEATSPSQEEADQAEEDDDSQDADQDLDNTDNNNNNTTKRRNLPILVHLPHPRRGGSNESSTTALPQGACDATCQQAAYTDLGLLTAEIAYTMAGCINKNAVDLTSSSSVLITVVKALDAVTSNLEDSVAGIAGVVVQGLQAAMGTEIGGALATFISF